MRVQRTRTKQLRAPLTTTLGHPKSTQCNFNSCSFYCWLDYSIMPQCPTPSDITLPSALLRKLALRARDKLFSGAICYTNQHRCYTKLTFSAMKCNAKLNHLLCNLFSLWRTLLAQEHSLFYLMGSANTLTIFTMASHINRGKSELLTFRAQMMANQWMNDVAIISML